MGADIGLPARALRPKRTRRRGATTTEVMVDSTCELGARARRNILCYSMEHTVHGSSFTHIHSRDGVQHMAVSMCRGLFFELNTHRDICNTLGQEVLPSYTNLFLYIFGLMV
jgi:hypothetical protein